MGMLASLGRELSTLRSRIALVVSLVFIAFASGAAYLIDGYLVEQFKQTVAADQQGLLDVQSDAIASKLRVAFEVLERTAEQVTPAMLDDPDAAQAFLNGKAELRSIFTNAVFLMAMDGRIVADTPTVPSRRGRLMPDAGKLPSPAQAKDSYVMDPFASVRGRNQPNLSIGVWVRDAKGVPVGRLHGGTFLLGENWLADLGTL